MHSRISRLVFAASVLALTACSGKKSTTQPPTTTPRVTVSTGAATLSVAQAAAGTAAITVVRVNFTGDVVLTAENLPTGVTATFTPATLSAGATASSLSLAASGAAAASATPVSITVRARGTGVTDATTAIALTITPAVGGAISIAATPAMDSIVAGQPSSSVVAITRSGGFTGGVNFTVSGAPTSGLTTTFSSANPVTANTVNLSIATLASLTPGTYTLILRANAAGLTEATVPFVLKIAAPPSNNVAWRFCDASRFPLWFAYQDGLNGTWQRVTETTPGVYNFAYGQPQVGVATVTTELGKIVTDISYYGVAEITAAAAAECTDSPALGTKSHTGAVSGFVNATEVALVSLGTALSSATNPSTTSFTISNVATGPLDLIAVRADIVTSSAIRVLLSRGVNVASGSSLGTLDLAGGTSFAPASSSITVIAPNDGPIQAQSRFTTATSSGASFTTAQLSSGVAGTYQGIPLASMIGSDVQQVQASQQVSTTLSRFITQFIRQPTAVTLTMPGDPGTPTVTNIAGTPYKRANVSGSVPTAFNSLITHVFNQGTTSRIWSITATPAGRTGTATSYAFALPDFSAVAGWQNTWALGAGSVDVTSTFFGQSNPLVGAPTTGTTLFTIGRLATFTFP